MSTKILSAIIGSLFLLFPKLAHAEDNEQIKCMADNIYYETRGETTQGKYAVGHVVMNRVKSGRFPSTPCSVIKQRARNVCQFSWVCSKRSSIKNKNSYDEALVIAKEIYYNKVKDVTNGAQYFHARRSRPSWAYTFIKTITIGNHVFYRGR